MAPPQVYELGRMKNLSSLDELNAAAAKYSSIQGLERLMPVMKMCSDAFVMLLPGELSDFIDFSNRGNYIKGEISDCSKMAVKLQCKHPFHKIG